MDTTLYRSTDLADRIETLIASSPDEVDIQPSLAFRFETCALECPGTCADSSLFAADVPKPAGRS